MEKLNNASAISKIPHAWETADTNPDHTQFHNILNDEELHCNGGNVT